MTTPRPRRHYPDAQRASALAALDATGGNVEATARQLGIPRKTLEGWAKGRNNPVGSDLRDSARADLADALEAWAGKLIGIDPTSLPNLTLRDVAVAVGIAVDKVLLLRGKPNAIVLTTAGPDLEQLTDAELLDYIARLRADVGGGTGGDEPEEAAVDPAATEPAAADPAAELPAPEAAAGGGGAGTPPADPGGRAA